MKLQLEIKQRRGIYRIYNTVNDASYIGSSINMRERINTHVRELNKGDHHSWILQRDWNKYGKDCFDVEVVEFSNLGLEDLRKRESIFMEKYNSHKDHGGYNILMETEDRCGWAEQMRSRSRHYICVSPDGEIFDVPFLSDFCEIHGLHKSGMSCVARGKFAHSKFWRCWFIEDAPREIPNRYNFKEYYNEIRATKNRSNRIKYNKSTIKKFKFIDPSGNIVTCDIGLKAFSQQYDLSHNALKHMTRGKQKSHRGWSLHQNIST